MEKTKIDNGCDEIRTALNKLKNEANAKEVEVIDMVTSFYENLKEKQCKAINKVREHAKLVDDSVHSHPWCYIGGASLLGVIAGYLLHRR